MRAVGLIKLALGLGLYPSWGLTQTCPNGITEIDVQPIKSIIEHAFYITGYIGANTVLTVGGGLRVPVTNAPVVISTLVTSTQTSLARSTSPGNINGPNGAQTSPGNINGPNGAQTSTGNINGPNGGQTSAVIPAFITTTVAGAAGSRPTTITVGPTGTRPGTIIVVTPGAINGPQQTGGGVVFTTVTEQGPAGAPETTVTILPTGTATQGTVVVVNDPTPFFGPFVTVTVAGPPGSDPTIFTLTPTGTGTVGTVIVETPGPGAFTGPYTTISYGYDGPNVQTITLQPDRTGTQGTVIVQTPLTGNINGPVQLPSSSPGPTVGPEPSGSPSPSSTTVSPDPTASPSPTLSLEPTVSPSPTISPEPVNPPNLCIPFAPDGPAFCEATLPAACRALDVQGVIATAADIATCTLALGDFAIGTVAGCLVLDTLGSSVVQCLETTLAGKCITNLPPTCLKSILDVSAGATLNTNVQLCANALGPFAGSNAVVTCLGTGVRTSGLAVVTCLQNAFGFPAVLPVLPVGCDNPPQQPRVCPRLPPSCAGLSALAGPALSLQVLVCQLDLGPLALGNTVGCRAQAVVSLGGGRVVSCLLSALADRCLTALPPACASLDGIVGTQLVAAQVLLCRPQITLYDTNGATACLTAGTNGGAIVNCLNNRLFGTGAGQPQIPLGKRVDRERVDSPRE